MSDGLAAVVPARERLVALVALVSGALTGLTAGVVGGAAGWLVGLLFRRLRLPAGLGLLLGSADGGGSLAAWFVSDFTGSTDAAVELVPVPAALGAVVLTAARMLVLHGRPRQGIRGAC